MLESGKDILSCDNILRKSECIPSKFEEVWDSQIYCLVHTKWLADFLIIIPDNACSNNLIPSTG